MNKLRIGILGTAGIARKNWTAIFHSGNCVVTAVASRNLERSRQFIAECQRKNPFEHPAGAAGQLRGIDRFQRRGRHLPSAADRLAQGMGPARGGRRANTSFAKSPAP